MGEYYLGLVLGAASWSLGRFVGRRYVDPLYDRLYIRARAARVARLAVRS